MNAKQLYDSLKKIQEKKGFYFNKENSYTVPLIESLLVNKDRYGYMACPCRLATGNYEADKDIICPCVYREPDIKDFGACFCGLYVSKDWNEDKIPHKNVPERRPPEKIFSALGIV